MTISRSQLLGFGVVYTLTIWFGAQPILATRGIPIIWVAAGVALAMALLFGYRALPVIFVGALLGYSAVLGQLDIRPDQLVTGALAFAASAVMQAGLARFLIRYFGIQLPPTSIVAVAHTSVLIGLALLSAPLLAAAVMASLGISLVAAWPFVGLQWWLDLIVGVWLVTPWIVVGYSIWQRQALRDPWLWPVTSVLLALLVLSVQLIWRDAAAQYRQQVERDASEQVSLIEDWLDRYEQALQSLSALFLASQEVEPHEFTVFSRVLLSQLPAARAVGWAPRVLDQQRRAFEWQIQESGIPDFAVRDPGMPAPVAGQRAEYYPLTYQEPFAERRSTLGVDLAAEASRAAAIALARDSGQVVMTPPLLPYLAIDSPHALVMLAPVYSAGPPPQSTIERRERITGVVALLMSPETLIRQALAPVETSDLDLLILDVTESLPTLVAYISADAARQLPVSSETFAREAAYTTTLQRNGRHWLIAAQPGSSYPSMWLNGNVISRIGIALASIALFFLFMGMRQRHESRQRRLTRTYALLSAINQMIIRERDPARIFAAACQIAVEQGHFRMAWIGRRNPSNNRLEPVAVAGNAGDYLKHLDIRLEPESACPTVQALLQQQPMIVNDLARDERVALWRERALALGYRASASFPLLVDGEVYATLSLYATEPAFFDQEEMKLLSELAQDIAFAIVVSRQGEQLRISEQRNQMIVSALPDIVFRLSRSGEIVDVAVPPGTALLAPPAAFLFQALEATLPPEISRQARAALAAAFASGDLQTIDYQLTIEGETRFFEARIKAIPGGSEAIAVVRDVTAWRQAEAQLQAERDLLAERVAERTAELSRANAELSRAVRAKDEFLANMSHELRTPLSAILALSESLLEGLRGSLTEPQQAAIRSIETSGRHLLALINDVLDVAKIEAGRMELSKEIVAVSDLCESSLSLIKEQAQKKRIALSMQIDQPHVRFLADPRRVKQILVNLLSNAVKFTPEGGAVTLQVTTDEAHGAISFTVRDTGIGIAPDQLRRLFQPFVQLDSRLSRQYEGTGLGLALVRRLTELHGGGVSVASEPGKGSAFTVTFPYQPLPSALVDAGHALPPTRLALVVTDSITLAEQVARYLEGESLSPVICSTNDQVIERTLALRPDLIIIDEGADRHGWSLLSELKRHPEINQTPMVIMSDAPDHARAEASSAVACLLKPLKRQVVSALVTQLFQTGEESRRSEASVAGGDWVRLLLADDNEITLSVLGDYLRMRGYQVWVARNGREALALAREQQPDLIIMDIQMPEMDGLEAIRQLRRQQSFAQTPIIALTALAMPGDRERCLLAGASEYLAKPVELRYLVVRIEQLLRRAQHAR